MTPQEEQLAGRLIGFAKDCITGGYASQVLADELAIAIISRHTATVTQAVNKVLDEVCDKTREVEDLDHPVFYIIAELRKAYPLTEEE